MPTGSPFAIDLDNRLCNAVYFRMLESQWKGAFATDTYTKIEFQFPPKITSDNRSGTWKEGELRGKEPIANYTTSGPREMTMAWTYIVEDRAEKGKGWTAQRIAQNVRNLRGYFSRVRAKGDQRNLVIEFGMWAHTANVDGGYSGSDYRATFRLKSVNVKHGPSLIVPTYSDLNSATSQTNANLLNNTIPFIAYPLRTDVVVDIRLWTNQGALQVAADGTTSFSNGDKTTDVYGLRDGEKPNWY